MAHMGHACVFIEFNLHIPAMREIKEKKMKRKYMFYSSTHASNEREKIDRKYIVQPSGQ